MSKGWLELGFEYQQKKGGLEFPGREREVLGM